MWIVKGTFLGTWLFAFGTIAFLYFAIFRNMRPNSAVSLNVITGLITQNPLWWVALLACIALGCALVGSWPGKVPSALWITLLATSAIPLGMLGLVILMVSKVKALPN